MYDTFSTLSALLRTELFLKEKLRLDLPAPAIRQTPRLPLGRLLLDRMGSFLIDAGLRLKSRALAQREPASHPTWLIML